MTSYVVLHHVLLLQSVGLLCMQAVNEKRQETENKRMKRFTFVSLSLAAALIHYYLFRHPGVSISGGSQLHHQHQGQELSFVAANALQSAMEPPFSQCRSQRFDIIT